ncbi:MAG: PilC/PilY family type IV pilus protein [Candidatus Methylumidiphilus sp.]
MKSNLLVACRFGFALLGFSVAAPADLDIAQIPLASCLTDAAYRSASAVAVDPVGGIIYQAKYRATDWSGKLLAYQADSTTGILAITSLWEAGDVLPDGYTLRRPYSFYFPDVNCFLNPSQCNPLLIGTEFKTDNLSAIQSDYLSPLHNELVITAEYIAGSREYENVKFRYRSTLLGDLVNSDPLFVGSEDFNYSSLPNIEGTSYQAFQNKKSKAVGGLAPRPRMVYVGGNDGMLHGFEAGTWNTTLNTFDNGHGTEIFNFIPGTIINTNLRYRAFYSDLITLNKHKFLVDGSPRAGDAYFSGDWHTVLLGTTGASPTAPSLSWGGRSIFALDVTKPGDFTTTTTGVGKVLWEFTDNFYLLGNAPYVSKLGKGADVDLGMTLAQPSLARMQNGKWAVIVGNGYNSKNQKPVLYLLDISLKPDDTNFIIAKISPCDASPKPSACLNGNNGLSTPIAVDVDSDRKVDYIYAGDLQGNLWKFDVTSSSSSTWTVANGGNPLFIACATTDTKCEYANRQPITGKPQVGSVSPDQANALYDATQTIPTISVMVYFGTGKYLGLTDNKFATSAQQQTFYALWDKNTGDADTDKIEGRSKLLQQEILTGSMTRAITPANGGPDTETVTNVRATSKNAPCYPESCNTLTTIQHNGWYMDLTTPLASPSERSVGFPLLINGNILFTTFIPPAEFDPGSIPCTTPSPSSWLMELDAITGSRLASSPFDLFGGVATVPAPDGMFNSFDLVTVTVGTAEEKMAPSGIQSTVGILKTPAIIPGIGVVNKYLSGSTGDAPQRVTNPGESIGRISWRQLR